MMRERWRNIITVMLLVGGILTMTINSWNAKSFGLQNATVAALVEHKTFALIDQVIPGFNLVEGTETFRYGKAVYPMKQPGGTIFGAIIYYPLYQLGFTFVNHFDYVSHLITLGTSTLLMVLSAILIYLWAVAVTKSETAAMIAALLYPLATLIWPYAGVSHHDIYGVFWSTAALYSFYMAKVKNNQKYLWMSGFFSTLTLFFTMLPLTLPLALLIMGAMDKRIKNLFVLGGGMIIGFLPNAIFNWINFGNPLLPPNLAGQVSDTMPLLSLTNFLTKLWFYLGSPSSAIIWFAPVLLFGVMGIWQMKKDWWLNRLLTVVPLLQLLHISSMETIGGFQYGPRYLLPTFACLILGIAIWLTQKHSRPARVWFVASVVYSISVAALGAVQTVMYPMPGPFAPVVFIRQIAQGELPFFRLFIPGLVLTLSGVYWAYQNKRLHQK